MSMWTEFLVLYLVRNSKETLPLDNDRVEGKILTFFVISLAKNSMDERSNPTMTRCKQLKLYKHAVE
jgi:hypothetical protein